MTNCQEVEESCNRSTTDEKGPYATTADDECIACMQSDPYLQCPDHVS